MNISELVGKTLVKIDQIGRSEIIFTTIDGDRYKMFHKKEHCNTVDIENIVGKFSGLLNTPIIKAEERIMDAIPEEFSYVTYTSYNIATVKGCVDITWFSESDAPNGEGVIFKKI